jgi:hypothetical protein
VRPTANIKENNQQQQQQHQSPQQQQQREKDYMEVEKEEEYMMTPEQQQKDQILRAYVPLYLHRYAKLIYLVSMHIHQEDTSDLIYTCGRLVLRHMKQPSIFLIIQ